MSLTTFKLNKPNLDTNISDKKRASLLEKLLEDNGKLVEIANSPKYLYYDQIKSLAKESGLSPEEYWLLVLINRAMGAKTTVIKSIDGDFFNWKQIDNFNEKLHAIDLQMGGQIVTDLFGLSGNYKQQFITKGIIEEAIASSQLEGAHTSRKVAKELLESGRQPRDNSERMIVNNYLVNKKLLENYIDKELSWEMLCEIQKLLTNEVLDVNDQGRMRVLADEITVNGQIGNEVFITHVPPSGEFLEKEIGRFIAFANDVDVSKDFTHPVVKAIMLHFWLGYLHPFVDGNGRLARVIFHWYLLRHNYWLFGFLSVSSVILEAPIKYAFAYIYAEQDSYNLNYFIDFNLRKIIQAFDNFKGYMERKFEENKTKVAVWNDRSDINERQKTALAYLNGGPKAKMTATSYHNFYNVSRVTATKELKKLVALSLLRQHKSGRNVFYSVNTN